MANGKRSEYYWRLVAFLAECSEYLDAEHSAFVFPDEEDVRLRGVLKARLVFRDGSQLHVRAALDDRAEIREHAYAYICYDPYGNRVFQYDDAPHHARISTRPHHLHRGERSSHGRERVYPIDLPQVDFITVVEQVVKRLR